MKKLIVASLITLVAGAGFFSVEAQSQIKNPVWQIQCFSGFKANDGGGHKYMNIFARGVGTFIEGRLHFNPDNSETETVAMGNCEVKISP